MPRVGVGSGGYRNLTCSGDSKSLTAAAEVYPVIIATDAAQHPCMLTVAVTAVVWDGCCFEGLDS